MDLEKNLREALAGPLPGADAQMRMAVSPRFGWDPGIIPDGLKHAAALALLYPVDGRWHLPLTVRAASLRSHTGQVSLPGGRVDPGESIEEAALREAYEEVGVIPSSVRVLGQLTSLHIPVTKYLLHPVVGVTDSPPRFVPAEQEVAKILDVPVDVLIDPSNIQRETWTRTIAGQSVPIDVAFFAIGEEQVWGATAMVLAELVAILETLSLG